jgi:hypothetical protein
MIGRNMINGLPEDSSLVVNITEGEKNIEGNISTRLVLDSPANETLGVRTSTYLRVVDKIIREDYIWFAKD